MKVMKTFSQSFAVHYFHKAIMDEGKLMSSKHPLYKIFENNCPVVERLLLRPMLGKPYC